MHRLFVIFIGAAGCTVLHAAAMQNVSARHNVSLSGPWRTIVDPYEAGYFDYRYRPLRESFGTNKKPANKSEFVEFDFDTAPQLRVPGDWNTQRPELLYYEGTIWYKRDFDYDLKPDRRLFVWFGAANYRAAVYLNGVKLGEHSGGFTPFQFEITGRVRPRGNFLIIKVDNQRRQEFVPTVMTDWWNYGGLTRDVRLVDVPETFVEDYSLHLDQGSRTHIAGWVRLNGQNKSESVAVRVADSSFTVAADTNGYAAVAFDAHVDLWSPENPKLYEVTIAAGSDRVTDRIGFRSIETRGRQLLLNGAPLRLRGVSIHAEAPFGAGRVSKEADARTLLSWAKELGCNFVRLAHYPHDEVMTRLADEMGLLVWSEIPVYWTISWENSETYRNAEQQLIDMIGRDKNRASIIFWSVANETPKSEARLKFVGSLAEKARSLDSTRLITAALETRYADSKTIVVDDPLGGYLDVVSCNEYIGWYDGLPSKIDGIQWKIDYDKPFVISEFGADAQAGRHGDDMTVWTEEFQANVYRRQIAMFDRIPFLSGTIAWVLMDFRSPRRMLTAIQDGFNRKGLYSERGEKKDAFHLLRNYYNGWKLARHDEFDGSAPDPERWSPMIGGNGNGELQYYTARTQNVSVENGMLVITALREAYTGADGVSRKYTSARLRTQGKFAQAYGRFEARIKIPSGQGMWPAFWMLGDGNTKWPDRGEIDIVENIGREPGAVHGTVHGPGYSGSQGIGKTFSLRQGSFFEDFHVFAIEWEPNVIRWYVDDQLYNVLTPSDLPAGARWVYDHPFYLLLNLAVGGTWPGSPGQTTIFPQSMYVDYVRVWSRAVKP